MLTSNLDVSFAGFDASNDAFTSASTF